VLWDLGGRIEKSLYREISEEYEALVMDQLKIQYKEQKMIRLRAITEENFTQAFELKLAEGQEKYVSHPIRSLAQAYVYREQCQPFGIYEEDTMVGYVMVIYDYDIPEYDIWHMMIDETMQGKGYGSEALDQVIDYIRTKPFGPSDRVALTCHRENAHAIKLYRQKGFTETGAEYDEEIEFFRMV
jgi:diamine N-acetyltransferase